MNQFRTQPQKVPCPVFYELYESGHALDLEGKPHKYTQNVPVSYGEALYGFVRATRPETVVEVGFACGTTSLAMLSAMRDNGVGRLITIDPGQTSQWHNCGRASVRRAGLEGMHEVIEDFDYFALPKLLGSGLSIDFAYIDGWHTFDYTLLDWFYIDRMLKQGGVVAFNDSHYRAVHRVIKFLLSHRHYQEIDVGLPRIYDSRIPLIGSIGKRLQGRRAEDRYFRKLDSWEGNHQFYAPF